MRIALLVVVTAVTVGLAGCESLQAEPPKEELEETRPQPARQPDAPEPGVIEIRAEDYAFNAPAIFPSGWVTLRFANEGAEPHFLLLWDLPDDRSFDDFYSEIATPFNAYYAKYRSGELDQATFFDQLIAAIPDWFYETVPRGGPGFTASGHTSETTIYLEPGDNYVMECYVRTLTQDDSFHNHHGMLRPLIVSEESSGLEPPEADVEISLSSFQLKVEGDLSAGSHVARINVLDTPEGFIRHNAHLARLDGGVSGDEVATWMNWVDAMLPPAPADFLGGAGHLLAGGQSYVTFELEPGSYVWVSEMHGLQGMVHEFTVE